MLAVWAKRPLPRLAETIDIADRVLLDRLLAAMRKRALWSRERHADAHAGDRREKETRRVFDYSG